MRRILTLIVAGVLAVTLGAANGCDTKPSNGHPSKAPAVPAPPPGKPGKGGEGGAQPAPVQGDPSAHNTQEGVLWLAVDYATERKDRKPACEWSLNRVGVGSPCVGKWDLTEQANDMTHLYVGGWEMSTTAKGGDVVWLAAQANLGNRYVHCMYIWKGVYHAFPDLSDDERRCGGTITLQ